ncbi:unnamed protein product, partial [Laminaria digitata]
GNYVYNNGDAGMALLESFNNDVSNNIFENNKYGVRFCVGCAGNVFEHNVISGSTEINTFSYLGSDEPEVGESGRCQNNTFRENTIVGGGLESLKIKEADGTQFIDNTFEDAAKIRFDDATGTIMLGNVGLNESELEVDNDACFDELSLESYEDIDYEPLC